MNKWKLKWLAWNCLRQGPVIVHDRQGNGYCAYVIFIRKGMKWTIVRVDEDIATLNGCTQQFMESEIAYAYEQLDTIPLSCTYLDNLPMVPAE